MNGARILLIEDEPALARGLSDTLRSSGFDVTVVTDGALGLDVAVRGKADLILLDVMLPKVNGYEICRTVRAQGLDMPILMLTAKGQEQDVVLGLNLGADDYIIKPFRVGELVARVRAFLRRLQPSPTVMRFGDCTIDLSGRRVSRAEKVVDLTARESALLLFFRQPPGSRVAARRDLEQGVGARRVRDAAQHRPVRDDAARESRAESAPADIYSNDSGYRLPVRAYGVGC
jgi:DNA-binding response OmpR family regulator